jgi:hypothetical protein
MTRTEAISLKKYIRGFVNKAPKSRSVFSHQCDNYEGGYCIRVYDWKVGSILEVGNPNKASVRGLVVFAKYGDM